jgi:hypothetical protein
LSPAITLDLLFFAIVGAMAQINIVGNSALFSF